MEPADKWLTNTVLSCRWNPIAYTTNNRPKKAIRIDQNQYLSKERTGTMTSKAARKPSPDTEEGANLQDRRGRRISLSCRMFFFGEDDFEGEATLLDVSTNGCRAESSVELKIGTSLKLSLFLPDFKWPLRVDQAIVRWLDGKQFGLEFTTIRLAQRERLRSLIMKVKP